MHKIKSFINNNLLIIILLLSLILRVINIDFPFFTTDEARIAFRGYKLSSSGTDELGRRFPLIFNSLEDYQLPLTSYLTALGVFILGKNDLGVRMPFILIGTFLVLLTYHTAKFFNPNPRFGLISSLIVTFSPTLIFLSKVPNDTIVLVFIFTLIFYLLINNKHLLLIILTMILAVLISKLAWFILLPFVFITTFTYLKNLETKDKIILGISLLLVVISFIFFLSIPQSTRSLSENNFSIFSNITIKNGINQLRGQGLEAHWPQLLEKVLFNKIHFLTVGFLNWFSQLQPSVFFGSTNTGIFQKVLIIPFLVGLVYIIKKGGRKQIMLLAYPLILTFPLLFLSSTYNRELLLSTVPFISQVIAFGFVNVNRLIKILIVCLMVFEIGINFLNLNASIKADNELRPSWVREMILDGLNESLNQKLAISDDLTEDIAPFIQWFGGIEQMGDYQEISFPYKFRQSKVSDIKIIGSDRVFYKCGHDKPTYIIASDRDVKEIRRWLNVNVEEITIKVYKDNLGHEVAYFFEPIICVF